MLFTRSTVKATTPRIQPITTEARACLSQKYRDATPTTKSTSMKKNAVKMNWNVDLSWNTKLRNAFPSDGGIPKGTKRPMLMTYNAPAKIRERPPTLRRSFHSCCDSNNLSSLPKHLNTSFNHNKQMGQVRAHGLLREENNKQWTELT